MPARAKVPTMKVRAVSCISPARPPISRMSWVCTAWMTAPEPRKSRALKKPWVHRWNMAAA